MKSTRNAGFLLARTIAALFAVVQACFAATAGAQTTHTFASPSDDRWHYPFNFTPGNRAFGSVFGTVGDHGPNGQPRFNDRDGMLIFAWNTATQIPSGQAIGSYGVRSVKITLTSESGASWLPDLTVDEWFTHDLNGDGINNADGWPRGNANDQDGETSDADAGRPIELFGAGFQPDFFFNEFTWRETTIFVGWNQQASPVARNPFPMTYQDGTLDGLHCEDSVKGLFNESLASPVFQFTPKPWAIGRPIGYAPGGTPNPFEVVFEVDLSMHCGAVRQYFERQLSNGRVIATITSLLETFQQAGSGFPTFYLNNPGGNPHPARLEIVLSPFARGDMDLDGDVDIDDAPIFVDVLLDPGSATAQERSQADVDANELNDGRDATPFLAAILGGC